MNAIEPGAETNPCPEVVALAALRNEEEIVARLRDLANRFGNVSQIWLLPTLAKADKGMSVYLIDFEMLTEALNASSALMCPMAGLNTVMVSIPRLV